MEGFVPAFKKQLNQRLDALKARLYAGGLESHAEYKEVCGEIRGLQLSIAVLSTTIKEIMEEEDDG